MCILVPGKERCVRGWGGLGRNAKSRVTSRAVTRSRDTLFPDSQYPSSVKAGRPADETPLATRRRVVFLVQSRKTTRRHLAGFSHRLDPGKIHKTPGRMEKSTRPIFGRGGAKSVQTRRVRAQIGRVEISTVREIAMENSIFGMWENPAKSRRVVFLD